MPENRTASEQSALFREAARQADADQSDDALDRIMGKLDMKKKLEPEKPAKK